MKITLFLLTILSCLLFSQSRGHSITATSNNSEYQLPTTQLDESSPKDWQTWRDTALFYAESGELLQAEGAIQKSFQLLTEKKEESLYEYWQANILDVEAYIKLLRGDDETALGIWKQTAAIYREASDNKALSQAVLNQIQALQNLGYYHQAEKGINYLIRDSRLPVWASLMLYQGILGAIEKNNYDVFSKRAFVGKPKKIASLPIAWLRAQVL